MNDKQKEINRRLLAAHKEYDAACDDFAKELAAIDIKHGTYAAITVIDAPIRVGMVPSGWVRKVFPGGYNIENLERRIDLRDEAPEEKPEDKKPAGELSYIPEGVPEEVYNLHFKYVSSLYAAARQHFEMEREEADKVMAGMSVEGEENLVAAWREICRKSAGRYKAPQKNLPAGSKEKAGGGRKK